MRTAKKKRARQKTGAPDARFLLALENPSLSLTGHRHAIRSSITTIPTSKLTCEIYDRLMELAARVGILRTNDGKPENAAEDLATVATIATSLLEDLAQTDAKLEIMLAAARRVRWPVNLQLGTKKQQNKIHHTLQGAKRAKEYLVSIRLGDDPSHPFKHLYDTGGSPFARAAELLLMGLRDWQQLGAWRNPSRNLKWSKKLLLLEYPMTAKNVDAWWAVAKQWMDEQWSSNNELFIPLIKHLKLQNPKFTPSTVKRQVIDDSLKKAFKALAIRPDL
jgi:hypothetical protein